MMMMMASRQVYRRAQRRITIQLRTSSARQIRSSPVVTACMALDAAQRVVMTDTETRPKELE